MKLYFLLAGLICSSLTYAQDCTGYYFLQNNKTIEMSIMNKKGDQSAKQVYTVSNVSSSDGTTTADIETEMFDKKGKTVAKSKQKIKCSGGIMMVDMKMSIPTQGTQTADAEVVGSEIFIEYPNNMNVGDELKNATMHLDMNSGSGMKQSIDMEVFDRKVEGKEKITTPAGSWDCYKISYKSKTRIKTMGIGMPMNIDGIEWFAPGFGIVKTQSKQGSTEIVAVR